MFTFKFFLATLATTALALTPFSSSTGDDEKNTKHETRMMIVKSDGSDHEFSFNVDGEDHQFDVSDWEEGDSQTITLEDGRNMVLRKEANGLSIQVGEDEKMMIAISGEEHGVRVIEIDGEGENHFVVNAGEGHSVGQHFSFVAHSGEHGKASGDEVFVVSSGTAASEGFSWVSINDEEVVVSGLGDLDEADKARLKQLLQEFAGEKEIVISPSVKNLKKTEKGHYRIGTGKKKNKDN